MNKIDLIINALSVAQNSIWSKLNEEALAAAHELQALKPVAWATNSEIDLTPEFFFSWTQSPIHEIPLYALDEVTK